MKKMIEVINDNLRSVVNGIKEHRKDAEKNLTIIKNEIDERVETASQYKITVENCRSIIAGYENEIAELERDLAELKEKFGSKNFKEILAAGDKEINNKIAEKRRAVEEQNNQILEITKKAHLLKRELTKLKDKKEAIESDLSKTLILEVYYEKRISAVIDYSIQNPDALSTYKEIDEVEDLNTEEIEDIDIGNIIDGEIFNEIDSISNGDEIYKDDIIEDLNIDFNISSSNNEQEKTNESENTVSENNSKESVEEINDDVSNNPLDNTMNIFIDTRGDIEPINSNLVDNGTIDHKQIHSMSEPITVNIDNLDNFDSQSETIFKNNAYSSETLAECGLVEANFVPEDLEMLKPQFDRANTLEFIGVIEKHGLSKDMIYNSVPVLINVTPQNLDKILTLLDSVSGNGDLSYIFRYLDKVNINKLEQNVALADDEGITELLISTLTEESHADLMNLLGLNEKEVDYIKKNNEKDYQIMINFPEVILANYNTLRSYNVSNAPECITRYPHRFTMNPSKFAAILDKYDPADLVRCINKNAAVIDKL